MNFIEGIDMDREALKREAAEAALAYVEPGVVIGVGAGSTAEHFVSALSRCNVRPPAVVAASDRTQALLESHGMTAVGLSEELIPLALYVDGADEVDSTLTLMKGGGGSLTREKVLATASRLFVCIVDESKLVARIGVFPLAVEAVPMSLHFVGHELRALGGTPVPRAGYVTDNGNAIVDVAGLDFADAEKLERTIGAIPGAVECGVFARRRADVVLVGTERGVRTLER